MAAPLRLVIVQHQADAPPGLLGDWAAAAGLRTEIVRPDRGDRLPDTAAADLVALLGSDEAAVAGEREWIEREARWVRDHVRASTPVLGVCFGAQLLSVVLG
ncbi:MAG: type 1 glutamine amidotransferase, partial [Actinomycetota bacterium]|nr:type 1 glutamine amidotransferase [Actinomycetota bacterium]